MLRDPISRDDEPMCVVIADADFGDFHIVVESKPAIQDIEGDILREVIKNDHIAIAGNISDTELYFDAVVVCIGQYTVDIGPQGTPQNL